MSLVEKSPDVLGLLPVDLTTLRPTDAVEFDLYVRAARNEPTRLYRERNIPFGAEDIKRLLGRGISTLYIRGQDSVAYREYLKEHVLTDESIPAVQRYKILKQASRTVFLDALAGGTLDRIVSVTEELGRDMVDLLWQRDDLLVDLFSVMAHDYTTFTHATNVSSYSVLLAQSYGIEDRQELIEIGQGGLLHDYGKQFIPSAVLEKEEKLTPEEQEMIREHPTRGFKELSGRGDLSWGQLMMVYQHHERFDGGGYPVGLVGKETHLWGRICSVADVFDALTRDRPYRKAALTQDVLAYLDLQAGRGFDEELVECWISQIKQCSSLSN